MFRVHQFTMYGRILATQAPEGDNKKITHWMIYTLKLSVATLKLYTKTGTCNFVMETDIKCQKLDVCLEQILSQK